MAIRTDKIREYILENVSQFPREIGQLAASHFGVTRSAVTKHLNSLIKDGLLEASGRTRARKYSLKRFMEKLFNIPITPELQEDIVWVNSIEPLLRELPQNVKSICEYGFTEMLNNAMDHSGSKQAGVAVTRNAVEAGIMVRDHGIGIFKKIQQDFSYITDDRHAAFELSKGLLTSDKSNHSGLGIFFTSRMFDHFMIKSGSVILVRPKGQDTWIFEGLDSKPVRGTAIFMDIHTKAKQTREHVFEAYGTKTSPLRFVKTHIPLSLMKHEGQELVSRSQAKRLLSRVNKFDEVLLDFLGITTIGHSFADEIFRVYSRNYPKVQILTMNTNPGIDGIIQAVTGQQDESK